MYIGSPASVTSVKNNIIANNNGLGIDAPSSFAAGSYNTFYANASGNSANYVLGTGDTTTTDPMLDAGGYYLQPGSPCIDSGLGSSASQ